MTNKIDVEALKLFENVKLYETSDHIHYYKFGEKSIEIGNQFQRFYMLSKDEQSAFIGGISVALASTFVGQEIHIFVHPKNKRKKRGTSYNGVFDICVVIENKATGEAHAWDTSVVASKMRDMENELDYTEGDYDNSLPELQSS